MEKKKYTDLIKKANEANTAYYDNDNPIMGDPEYDKLMQEIRTMEQEHPEFITPDSPTQHIGGTASKSTFEKVEHAVPMLSLQDVFGKDEVQAFLSKFPDDTVYSV